MRRTGFGAVAAEKSGVLVVNKPASLRDCNEKIFATHFPQCCPPHLVTANSGLLRAFARHGADLFGSDSERVAAASAALERDLASTFVAFVRFAKDHNPNFRFRLGAERPPSP